MSPWLGNESASAVRGIRAWKKLVTGRSARRANAYRPPWTFRCGGWRPMDTLHNDWNAFSRLLRAHRVRFVIVGGHAVAAHGHPRFTADLDILIEATLGNAGRRGTAPQQAPPGDPRISSIWSSCVSLLLVSPAGENDARNDSCASERSVGETWWDRLPSARHAWGTSLCRAECAGTVRCVQRRVRTFQRWNGRHRFRNGRLECHRWQ
jgi:hypothetical protein